LPDNRAAQSDGTNGCIQQKNGDRVPVGGSPSFPFEKKERPAMDLYFSRCLRLVCLFLLFNASAFAAPALYTFEGTLDNAGGDHVALTFQRDFGDFRPGDPVPDTFLLEQYGYTLPANPPDPQVVYSLLLDFDRPGTISLFTEGFVTGSTGPSTSSGAYDTSPAGEFHADYVSGDMVDFFYENTREANYGYNHSVYPIPETSQSIVQSGIRVGAGFSIRNAEVVATADAGTSGILDVQEWEVGHTASVVNAFSLLDGVIAGRLQGEVTLTDIAPVPVPPAAWLLGSGLIGVLGCAKRRRSQF
jgi:hypothetical protein